MLKDSKDVESQVQEQAVAPDVESSNNKTSPTSRWRCLKLLLHVRHRLTLISLANTSTNIHGSLALNAPSPPHSTVTATTLFSPFFFSP